jgi:N-acetylglucosaminyldiphosphoundecaprenol N-acetyl-beta-D-mannosaminyltransferase
MNLQPIRFGKVRVDRLSFMEAVTRSARLKRGSVFTPNVDHVVLAEEMDDFAAAYERCAISVTDGFPLFALSKFTSRPIPAKVSGSDLMLPLMRAMGHRKRHVMLVGPSESVAIAAQAKLERDCAGLKIPYAMTSRIEATPQHASRIADLAVKNGCDVVLLSLGSPKQELLADMVTQRQPLVCLCFGAALDFYVGHVKRAPRWVSAVGLEWAYRLVREPSRLIGRYVRDAVRFPPIMLKQWRNDR